MSTVSGHKCLKDQTATDETSEMQHELELLHDECFLYNDFLWQKNAYCEFLGYIHNCT